MGWNYRAANFGEGDLCDLTGSYIPFAVTKAQRITNNDPRPSLEERYGSGAGYAEAVTVAANALVRARLMLASDVAGAVANANAWFEAASGGAPRPIHEGRAPSPQSWRIRRRSPQGRVAGGMIAARRLAVIVAVNVAECLFWVKLRRSGTAQARPVDLQRRKYLATGRHSRSVPIADIWRTSSNHRVEPSQSSSLDDGSCPQLSRGATKSASSLGFGINPRVAATLAGGHVQHRHAFGRLVSVPAALRDDHKIAGAQRSDQLFIPLANCQLGAARKHMQELIVARVKLPRRPPDEARDATDAAVEIKRLDLAWRLLGRSGEITSDHLADGVSAEVMNNHRTFLVLGPKRHA
jgi:hypothetical protein